MDTWRKWVGVAAVGVAVVTAVVLVLTMGGGTTPTAQPAAQPATPAPAAPLTGTALAVKIDNVSAARPQTGIAEAEVIYVEPVEGGLTRLVAVYTGPPPAMIGPVRSARGTDIELLGQYGTPVFAYSGAAPELLPSLHAANLVNASPQEAPSAYYRDSSRAVPHNEYLQPARLPGTTRAPAEPPLRFGPAPGAGTPTATYQVTYPAARFGFTWSASTGRWLVTMDGTPVVDTATGQVGAATVVQQHVQVTLSAPGQESLTGGTPVAHTVGSGQAVVLRDGQSFSGTWSRPTAQSPTTFHTADGRELPLASGPVWVLLTS